MVRFQLEENSYTTLSNIRNATRKIARWRLNGPIDMICISSEANQRWKVRILTWLAMSDFGGVRRIRAVAWEKGWRPKLKQAISTPAEVAAFFIPRLATMFEESRIRRAARA